MRITGTGRATKEPAAAAAVAITAVTGSTTAVTAATGAPAPAGGLLAVAANGNHGAAEVATSTTAVENQYGGGGRGYAGRCGYRHQDAATWQQLLKSITQVLQK